MKINSNTRISVLIKDRLEAIDAITSINPHFNKLRNPILRRVLAPRVTIADAVRIGKCTMKEMMDALAAVGFEIEQATEEILAQAAVSNQTRAVDQSKLSVLDVRPILESGADPFSRIMEELKQLPAGHTLEVINTFEPTPLIRILEKKGYATHVREEGEAIITSFTKGNSVATEVRKGNFVNYVNEAALEKIKAGSAGSITELDVRDLEMPLPMMAILGELETLPEGHALYVYHKKVPQFLLPELQDRGFRAWIAGVADNDVRLIIHK